MCLFFWCLVKINKTTKTTNCTKIFEKQLASVLNFYVGQHFSIELVILAKGKLKSLKTKLIRQVLADRKNKSNEINCDFEQWNEMK